VGAAGLLARHRVNAHCTDVDRPMAYSPPAPVHALLRIVAAWRGRRREDTRTASTPVTQSRSRRTESPTLR
jgi:hypothetical protein